MENTRPSLGVIIGRFQVAELHAGHRHLIETVLRAHPEVLIVLGMNGGQPTNRNPLDVETRRHMLCARYPNLIVCALPDHPSNEAWSRALDDLVQETANGRGAILYGSRDCFHSSYSGHFSTETVPALPHLNGTAAREHAGRKALASRAFRQGVIYATQNRFPTSYQTVDIVIVRKETGHILMGRKTGDEDLRFPGGFVDPSDASLEAAAKREAYEETSGLELGTFTYAGSMRINDYRYRGSADGVMTAIFTTPYVFGALCPGDDLERLEWVRIEEIEARVAPFHLPIWQQVKHHFTANGG